MVTRRESPTRQSDTHEPSKRRNTRHWKVVDVFTLTLVLAGVVVGSAMADPTGSERSVPVKLTCGSTTYFGVLNGNGEWGPAHDLNSTSTLIPVSFGPKTETYTPLNGSPQVTTQPSAAKGSASPNARAPLDCTYLVGPLTFPNGDTYQAEGTVIGFITHA